MANSLIRTVLIAALCFVVLVIGETHSREAGPAEPRSRGVNDLRPNKARLMRECDKHITECGVTDAIKVVTDAIKVVTKPASTIRVQETVTTVITKELPKITNIVTKVDVTTINNRIQGHYRNTTIYVDPKPAMVTEYVTIEHIKEIVSVVNSTTTTTSTVTGKTIEQCFINTESLSPQSRSTQANAEVPAPTQPSSPPAVVVDHGEAETEKEHVMRYHRGEHYAEEMWPESPVNFFEQMQEPEVFAVSEAAIIASDLTTEATSTIWETSSVVLPETTTTVELTTTTTTSKDITTTTTAAEDTTTLTETSAVTISDAVTISEAPAGEPTCVLGASGGSLNGAQPQGTGQQGTLIAFDPTALSGVVPRKFTIDSIGRLQDAKTQAYVCAYYYSSSLTASPPFVVYCSPGPVGGRQAQQYLTCEVNNGDLMCIAPVILCSTDDDDETTCSRPGGDLLDNFFTGSRKFWCIGSGSPANTSPISVSGRK